MRPGRAARPPLAPRPTNAEIREWAIAQGLAISDRGRVPAAIREAFEQAQSREP